VRFESALEVQYLITPFPVIEQKLLCGNLTSLLRNALRAVAIGLRLKCEPVDLSSELLTASVSELVFSIFSLFQTSAVQPLSVVGALWRRALAARGPAVLRVRPLRRSLKNGHWRLS